ncbi:MAG: GNAT family N-acetyltransferase [bacterium]|nr:GNAT family N-acetyltransferase [bacterium]
MEAEQVDRNRRLRPSPERYHSTDTTSELPDGFSAEMIADQWGAWAVTLSDTGETIGGCTFDRKRGPLELSCGLMPGVWGNGYASEACVAAVEWVWHDTDERSIIAVTQTANRASMALLDRFGFTEQRRFEEHGAQQSMQFIRRPS